MTVTSADTLKKALTRSEANTIPDALRLVDLGAMLDVGEYDTGTITAAASITLPGGAMLISSCRVVTAGTAATGVRSVSDSAATPSATVASLSAAGTTITFEGTVTRVIVRYIKKPATDLTTKFTVAPG
jgi:hypothetical protein